MKFTGTLAVVLVLLSALGFARKRDPLNDAETDQLRQVAMEPEKRLKLLIKFSEDRLDSIDQLRGDEKQAQGRGAKIHDLLEDFTAILDETNDNLDQYQARALDKDQHKDYRKGLKLVIEGDNRFQIKLRALKYASENDPQAKAEARDYSFALQDALESVKSSLDMAREYLTEKSEEKPQGKK